MLAVAFAQQNQKGRKYFFNDYFFSISHLLNREASVWFAYLHNHHGTWSFSSLSHISSIGQDESEKKLHSRTYFLQCHITLMPFVPTKQPKTQRMIIFLHKYSPLLTKKKSLFFLFALFCWQENLFIFGNHRLFRYFTLLSLSSSFQRSIFIIKEIYWI